MENQTADEMMRELCEENGVVVNDDGSYTVPSSQPGKTYRVAFDGRSEDGFATLWSCTCPAGEYGRTCKHVALVSGLNNRVCDEFGLD